MFGNANSDEHAVISGGSACRHGKVVFHKERCPATAKRGACTCCGCDDEGELDHQHDHNYGSEDCCSSTAEDKSDCCAEGCRPPSSVSGIDQDHGHDYVVNPAAASGVKGCCGNNVARKDTHGQDHGYATAKSIELVSVSGGCCKENAGSQVKSIQVKQPVEVYQANVTPLSGHGLCNNDTINSIPTLSAMVCSSCDPTSPIAHAIKVTRFRVANLCCAGEEKIIREALGKMTGVEGVAVNIVGRYAVVKHCPIECCAPGTEIMNVLNELRLGVSIHDVGDHDGDAEGSIWHEECNFNLLHVCCVFSLFIGGLGMYLHPSTTESSMWVFVSSVILGLPPIAWSTWISVFVRRCIDIHLLMIVAIVGAIAGKEYFDGSLVVALFLIAEHLEGVVMRHVQRAVSSSTASSMPKKAFLANGKQIEVAELKVGDILAARAGEMVVCDGYVVKGEGVLDESSLTGESVPISKTVGSNVLSGTVVQNGYLEIKVEKNPQDSTFRQLQQAVEDVQADKGEFAKLVDTFSQYWTPLVLVATFLLIVIGGCVTKDWWSYVNRGLVLLVLACPCAIVIAAPIPAICAISTAARNGVLVRGSSVIEKICTIDTVAVDKTGTLTKGKFVVVNRHRFVDDDEYDPMELAVALEQRSTHPLANAVISDFCGCIAEAADVKLPDVKKVKVIDGVGIEGWVCVNDDWKPVMVGNDRMLMQNGGGVQCSRSQFSAIVSFAGNNPACVILIVAVDDEVALLLALADEVRGESASFVASLHAMDLTVTMLTGDHQDVARQVCGTVGIPLSECNARLRTDQKLEWIMESQTGGSVVASCDSDDPVAKAEEGRSSKELITVAKARHVMMIGDGINDSTALAASTVGVAMGAGGTAMAVAAADVVLLNDNLMLLPLALEICKTARYTIIENCTIAVVIKLLSIVLAILGLLKFWAAVVVDIGTLLVVVLNGIKLLAYRKNFVPLDRGKNYGIVPRDPPK